VLVFWRPQHGLPVLMSAVTLVHSAEAAVALNETLFVGNS